MASRIIATHNIGGAVVDLIKAANKVTLVSPYLAPWGHLDSAIEQAARKGVDVSVIFRRDKRSDYKVLTDNLLKKGVTVADIDKLHAKVYVSDKACIMTSMNLLDFSSANSEEFALYSDEPQMLSAVQDYVAELREKSEVLKQKSILQQVGTVAGKAAVSAGRSTAKFVKDSFRPGYCIRCGNRMEEYDIRRPFCDKHWVEWSKYKNVDYEEKHCHSCGKVNRGSMSKPVCYACYKKDAPVKA